jgi:hypothetical protein
MRLQYQEDMMSTYNLSSNQTHRISFDERIRNTLADAQEAYGEVDADWTQYIDLAELDVDDEAEATARIEAIWPKQ